ncbi:thiamin-phosphate kinase [Desulfobotulus alkaliphilus]|uniref:Thiamine-monophosphate kinase n=1 Tax=Desulfobotulus alkaliphilus TaxID=622671 RepID=A0A562S0A0_9BACT|nr:thiamine-phosphate kinase [Desulfobotulus alkaliphilus]TWI73936.1 thiamin-phosphate kinase [Desulfobotulus alkaliphilus]
MNPKILTILDHYYPEGHPARAILLQHSRMVARKALDAALQIMEEGPDLNFIAEAALLHDIGIGLTHAPDIGCHGKEAYICHGFLGHDILKKEGLPRHALVCERHTGTGLSKEEILKKKLPLPQRDMQPVSLEEEIICYADKFFSKNPGEAGREKPLEVIRSQLARFGDQQLERFDNWHRRFGTAKERSAEEKAFWDEFGLIRKLTADQKDPAIPVGPGDDAALLPCLQRPVISTDTQREGVHFLRNWMSFEELGYKAVMAAASDLAASFARPLALFVNLGLPPGEKEADILALQQGMHLALKETGGSIAGGNICKAEVLCVDLFMAGEGGEIFPRRSHAKSGEGIYVTGFSGDAAAGCHALLSENPKGAESLIRRFIKPKARFDAAILLADAGVRCLMDLSDGLAGDALHLAKASGLTLALDPHAIPLSPELLAYASRCGKDPLFFALTGGEDYELLFTAEDSIAEKLRSQLPGITRIGTCLGASEGKITGLPEWATHGFSHGKKA